MKKLETMTAEQLQSAPYAPVPFLVEELLPEGLRILAGAPKIGKSWLALWLCLCVSQGQPLWNFAVTQCEVLYLSLEDSYRRIQSRLFDLTDDAPQTLHFAIMADTLKHGLEQQIEQFLAEHPATKLVVIDTLQRVRSAGGDSNLYANDYQDVGLLKQLADKHHIAILLIHHLRKLHDDDPMNMISGSTGLSGAADSAFVLQKNARSTNAASLHCTGRDIPDRTLKLELGEEDHVWKLLSDSKTCTGASKISTHQLVHLLQGCGQKEIARRLNALDCKTPAQLWTEQIGHDARKAHKTGDGKFLWTYASVKNILTEEAYTGVLINHRREYRNGKAQPVSTGDWLRHENFYPAIIEETTWFLVQERLKQQARPAAGNRAKHRYAGLLSCRDCGDGFVPMIRYWNGSQRVEYVCRRYHRNGKSHCSSHRIHEEVLDESVWDYTKKLREQYAAEFKKVTQLQKQWALRKPVLDAHCLALQREVLKLEQEIDELVMAKMNCE